MMSITTWVCYDANSMSMMWIIRVKCNVNDNTSTIFCE